MSLEHIDSPRRKRKRSASSRIDAATLVARLVPRNERWLLSEGVRGKRGDVGDEHQA